MIPGLELSRRFYLEAVAPLVHVPHSAARLDTGSEVLGYDTEISADHEWGPRCQVFIADLSQADRIHRELAERLPKEFLGYPTHFEGVGVGHMTPTDGPVAHRVEVTDIAGWAERRLGFDPRLEVTTLDWLATPTQELAQITGGTVFHDGLDQLDLLRRGLAWYPDHVFRYVLACQWRRIAQEEAFVGRAGEVGDEIGSAVVAARLVRELIRLVLLYHRVYPPYSKWLGSAFARLGAQPITDILRDVLTAVDYRERGDRLADAYEFAATTHNLTPGFQPVDGTRRTYYGRPYPVLLADRFVEALLAGAALEGTTLSGLPLTGAVDQWTDSTDLAMNVHLRRAAVAGVTRLD
ncbi:DUF4037 domain-containing protein [Actinokineospora sp. NBRC 105648]|uniref:DUF4037 domain-containing protein n=1 Tax=Actinokineospora sp. NBRC 105648 TaxID=3032206 RepID=UPI0024A3F860|nr:DUF4037 domain-containing protein [Actinokineospora sp. NBRC 105648]GLZ37543.1 hypothetical protein Acsp05_11680 [Actinokineospora sp. NBRC 105648]